MTESESRGYFKSGSMIDSAEATTPAAEPRPRILALDVEGMMCQKNCGTTVKRALEAFPGVLRADVSFPAGRAWVWVTDRVASRPEAVAEALEDIGFGVQQSSDVELILTAENSGGIAHRDSFGSSAESVMCSVPGVVRAEAVWVEGRARAWTAANRDGGDGGFVVDVGVQLVRALASAGFGARVAPDGVLEVEGMMCQKNCGSTVRQALEGVTGVARAEVSFAEKRAKVWALDGPRLPLSVLVDAVESVGFGARVVGTGKGGEGYVSSLGAARGPEIGGGLVQHQQQQQEGVMEDEDGDDEVVEVELPKVLVWGEEGKGLEEWGRAATSTAVGVFSVSGMSCASCVGNVERFVSGLEGVEDVRVALLAEKAEVRFDPRVLDGQRLAQGITGLGYPSRHLSTTVVSDGEGGGQGNARGEERVSLEVSGVFRSACVEELEAAVRELPGVVSCSLTPAYHLSDNGDSMSSSSNSRGFATSAFPGTQPNGLGEAGRYSGVTTYLLTASLSPAPLSPQLPMSGSGSDAVWAALGEAYDGEGKRKFSGVRDVFEAVWGLGYRTRVLGSGGGDALAMEASQGAEVAEWRRLLTIAVAITIPVLIIHAADEHADGDGELCGGEVSFGTLLSWVLVTVVQVVVGRRFYRNAYKSARHWSFGMDMLVVVGTSVSYLYSTLSLLLVCVSPENDGGVDGAGGNPGRPHLFLESPAMLLTFIALGKFLEVLAKRKTSRALVVLLKAQPHRAVLVEPEMILVPSPNPSETPLLDNDDLRGGVGRSKAEGWRERNIEASLVQPGDVVRVFPGAQFPTDGTVISGSTYVDESMITGESIPVAKGDGDTVCGGTVNQHGSVFVRAERVGEDTMLAQLCRLVEEAQMSKAPIQRQADRVAGVFVPAVMMISVITFLGWFLAGEAGMIPQEWLAEERSDAFLFALLFGVSVVVVACPCALGLATPTAVMVGTGVGAGNGVLIKGGAALEAANRVNTVVFDKTGTLTEGKPVVTNVVPIPSAALDRLASAVTAATTERERDGEAEGVSHEAFTLSAPASAVLALAAACEACSEHPVGRAVVEAAEACCTVALGSGTGDGAKMAEFVSEPGRGVACEHPLGRVCVGNRVWAESNGGKRKWVAGVRGKSSSEGVGGSGIDTLSEADGVMRGLEEAGKTAVIVTLGGEAVGVVAVADADKKGSRRAVLALGRMGLDVWVVTGDNRRVAAALARRLGVSPHRVMSEVLPAEKARKVADLQLAGGYVAMVGDGVNDAPALATADVGIAVGAGTQVAMEAADMVLVRSDVCDVVSALHLGRKVFGRIRLNFVFAMVYNVCGVPVAAGILYPLLRVRLPPALAGLFMALSSISVVLSSLALRLYRKPKIEDDGRLLEVSVASIIREGFYAADRYIGRCLSWRRRRGSLAQFHAFENMAEEEADNDRERNIRGVRKDRRDGGWNWLSSVRHGSGSTDSEQSRDWARTKDIATTTRGRPYALVRTQSGGVAAAVNEHSLGDGHGGNRLVSPDGVVENGVVARVGEKEEAEGGIELVGHFV